MRSLNVSQFLRDFYTSIKLTLRQSLFYFISSIFHLRRLALIIQIFYYTSIVRIYSQITFVLYSFIGNYGFYPFILFNRNQSLAHLLHLRNSLKKNSRIPRSHPPSSKKTRARPISLDGLRVFW